MPRDNAQHESICKFCSQGLAKGEWHEEFDVYKHPQFKDTLKKLDDKLHALFVETGETGGGLVELYAKRRGIKGPNGVVMPAYGRLLNAYKWLQESKKQYAKNATTQVVTDLPF